MEISSEGRKKSRNPSLGWICRDKRNLYLVLKRQIKNPPMTKRNVSGTYIITYLLN